VKEMGKQLTNILKSKAEELYAHYPDKFTEDYKENKEVIKKTGLFDYSKRDRNLVAGYITRLKQKEEIKVSSVKKYSE
jgi:ribosomal protein S17E